MKKNQKGIAHIVAPLLFVVIFAAVGSYVILSHAAPVSTSTATTYTNDKIYYGNFTIDPDSKVLKKLSPTPDDFAPQYSSMSFNGKRVAYFGDPSLGKLKIGKLSSNSITNAAVVASIPSYQLVTEAPEWSPDNTKAAVVLSTTSKQNYLWIPRTDGSTSSFNAIDMIKPFEIAGWRPGSESLMYVPYASSANHTTICTISIGAKNLGCHAILGKAKLNAKARLGGAFALSPTGDKLVLVAYDVKSGTNPPHVKIYTVNADGSNLKPLITLPNDISVADIVWSPNSKKVAYMLNAYGSSTSSATGLYVKNADGSNKPRILTKTNYIYPNSLSWAHQ